jgi:hypothetical protein
MTPEPPAPPAPPAPDELDEPAPLVGQGRRPPGSRPWPRLPWWVWSGIALAVVAFVVLGGYGVALILRVKDQPLFKRRTPSAPGQSHAVGTAIPSAADPQPVACGTVSGLQVAGSAKEAPLLREALGGVCKYLKSIADGPALSARIEVAARRGVVVSFGVFTSTGDDSTTVSAVGSETSGPPRLLVNNRFADNVFKGFLAPVLAHELWHAGAPRPVVTAAEERLARRVEAAVCGQIPTANETSRSCRDAQQITARGIAAEADLHKAGYP